MFVTEFKMKNEMKYDMLNLKLNLKVHAEWFRLELTILFM